MAITEEQFSAIEFKPDKISERETHFVTELTAEEIETVRDHPLQRLVELGFDTVRLFGDIDHEDGSADFEVIAMRSVVPQDAPFVNREAGDCGVLDVKLRAVLRGSGRRGVDISIPDWDSFDFEDSEGLVTEEAWQALKEVRDGLTARLEAEHSGK